MNIALSMLLGSSAMLQGTVASYDVRTYGALGDGVADDTAAIQSAMDAAAQTGGIVSLPPGQYLVRGSLSVPPGVALVGANQAPLDIGHLLGTVIRATGGRDDETAPALFKLGDSSAVMGLTVYYPEQSVDDIRPYPWTFHLVGLDNTVENVTLINSYNGIRVGPEPNVRHRIRSVYGCVLRRGIFVDACTDIGRIENVQFHCHWWSHPATGGRWEPVYEFMWRNLEAFVFARTDWEYVTNTFVFPTNIGYRFIATENGAANGQFCGIGSDASQVCVQVDAIQPMGLLITNGQFVSFNGDNPVEVIISETCTGSVRLVNCAFWGPARQNVIARGTGFLSLSDCYLSTSLPDPPDGPLPLVDIQAGRVQVRGCSFGSPQPSVRLGSEVSHAIVTANNGIAGVSILSECGDRAVIADNEPGVQ